MEATLTLIFNNITNEELIDAVAEANGYKEKVRQERTHEIIDNPVSKTDFVNARLKEQIVPTIKRGLESIAVKKAKQDLAVDNREF